MLQRLVGWFTDTNIKKLVNEEVGKELGKRFEATHVYLEAGMHRALQLSLRAVEESITIEVLKDVHKKFKDTPDEDGEIVYMVKRLVHAKFSVVWKDIRHEIRKIVDDEEFLDEIVDRIRKKQLPGD